MAASKGVIPCLSGRCQGQVCVFVYGGGGGGGGGGGAGGEANRATSVGK